MFKWKAAYAPNCICADVSILTVGDIKNSGFDVIDAVVPGNFELDLMRSGRIEDLYYSENTLKAQKLENMHVWYFTEFEVEETDSYLHFEGIDTIAEIFVNGRLVKTTDNMFISYDVHADFKQGRNEMIVHIKPVCIEARKYEIPALCNAQKHNYASLYIRKAAHMFGWDIMPRIVSAGIWKPVVMKKIKKDKIRDVYFTTNSIDFENNTAEIRFCINADLSGDFITDYSVRVSGCCGESSFDISEVLWHSGYQFKFNVENCRLWWPKNYGAQNLYRTRTELYYKDELCDAVELNIGIRMVELNISDTESEDKIGDFCFKVNGQEIFVLGTNWVPLDAFHSQDTKRLERALDLLDDIGCNAVRCWGGNVYESDEFFDFCDRRGIMVWQDFAMGCAAYPQEEEFLKRLEEEAVYQIKRLRNHASLILWAGDNECDLAYREWSGYIRNPGNNVVTRDLLKKLTELYDYSRPYLPSSPFISEKAHESGLPLPEDHLWGPRDYFKGGFYKNAKSRFASETGYHGFPSPASLKKFLEQPERIFKEKTCIPTDEYAVHAASPELGDSSPYIFRIGLAYGHVETLFGRAENNFEDFIRQSQISQAEAKKYFIEKFRLKKWECTGIIWWNLLDGWPQISDAVVDYYFCKKLAYNYIKRSQQPICFMFKEPEDGKISLYAVNDLGGDTEVKYTVRELYDGEKIIDGNVLAKANSSVKVNEIEIVENEQKFYLIEWLSDGKIYKNHYCTNLLNIDYNAYMSAIRECGFDEFEGFI